MEAGGIEPPSEAENPETLSDLTSPGVPICSLHDGRRFPPVTLSCHATWNEPGTRGRPAWEVDRGRPATTTRGPNRRSGRSQDAFGFLLRSSTGTTTSTSEFGALSERSRLIATTAFVARLPCFDVPRLARPCALGRPEVRCAPYYGAQTPDSVQSWA